MANETPTAAAAAAAAPAEPVSEKDHHAAFFREGGWLMISGLISGVFMWAVHFLSKAKSMTEAEYGLAGTMLSVLMFVPTGPLQQVFAYQTAADIALNRRRQMAGKVHFVWFLTMIMWVVVFAAACLRHGAVEAFFAVTNPALIWLTLVVILFSLWQPVFMGVLQGKQDFFWYGWTTILNGVGRLGIAAGAVILLSMGATGVMTGILVGTAIALAIPMWRTRDLWLLRGEKFDRKAFIGEVGPLLIGFTAAQILFTSDTIFVKRNFSEQAAFYVAAGTLSRALIWAVGPLTSVMFPKLVDSNNAGGNKKVNYFALTMIATAALVGCGALCLCLLGPFVVKIVYPKDYVAVTTRVLPWMAGAMVPLSIANVLVYNLLAKAKFRIVPPLVILAVTYLVTMTLVLKWFPGHLTLVPQIMGLFTLLLLALCVGFSWATKDTKKAAAA